MAHFHITGESFQLFRLDNYVFLLLFCPYTSSKYLIGVLMLVGPTASKTNKYHQSPDTRHIFWHPLEVA